MNDVVGLRKYGKALEESFFEQENQKLLAKLREEAAREKKRTALRAALKIDDDALLDHLVELDLSPETIVALTLVPLIEVAWADGEIQDKERGAILRAAEDRGIAAGSINHQLLDNWLQRQPKASLLEVWRHYVKALLAALGPDDRRVMRDRTIGAARAVAEAAGGFLGIGAVSSAEKLMLQDLESTFE